jgi:phage tail sheath protein FI
MPVHYSTPGVYIERLDRNPQQIGLRRTDIAGFVGVADRGPIHTALKIESWRQFVSSFGEPVRDGYLGYAVAGFFGNGGRTCWVVRAANPEGAVPARVRLLVEGWGTLTLEATSPGAWGNHLTVEAIWSEDRIVLLKIQAPDKRSQLIDLSTLRGGPPVSRRIQTNLLGVADSALPEFQPVELVRVADSIAGWSPLEELGSRHRLVRLSGGLDGARELRLEHLIGHPNELVPWGLAELERVDGVGFVAIPDLMRGQDPLGVPDEPAGFGQDVIRDAQEAIISSCMRSGDRIAILDLPRTLNKEQAIKHRHSLPESSFGSLYYPWILVDDPLRLRGLVRPVPPCGHVAGVYARSDRLRGVHKPPANEILEGVRDVNRQLDVRAHGDLNDNSINAIRPVPGRGILVLGVRTLNPDIRWRYVNIRRLFSMIEEALDEQLQWLVFEPNNPQLWREIDRVVAGFLERLYRLGMLDGATSEEAYSVRCDASTNPSWETDLGKVTCIIGIQPPYPAEFVVVRLGVTRSGIQIEEKGAQSVED